MNMPMSQTILQYHIEILQQANAAAASSDIDELAARTLDLCLTVMQASAGAFYLYDVRHDALDCRQQYGDAATQAPYLLRGSVYETLHHHEPVLFANLAASSGWRSCEPGSSCSFCSLVLHVDEAPVGLVQLFGMPPVVVDDPTEALMLAHLVAGRMATEFDKLMRLARAQLRAEKLEALVDFISHLSTTLERSELIQLIMEYAEKLINVEATSFWLLDEHNRLNLLVTAGDTRDTMPAVSVALGEGIIGHVVQTGQLKVVNDVRNEPLFANRIDDQSGFVTRSIISAPMLAPIIKRGDLDPRGAVRETIIGGVQALNKRDGSAFNDEDTQFLVTLARQAAIAFQFSRLFEEDHTLFWGVVRATTSAIDFTDPYARGHSARVSDFSVAIAEQLDLPKDYIFHVRVGSMLHDIGKIGVSEQVLRKPGYLTPEEQEEVRRHPMYGVELLQEAGLGDLLREELLAMAQHHERLDGTGYPAGLRGAEISLIGRIVAVADVFDALTSDRPYRAALSLEDAFEILERLASKELDADCVEALMSARAAGKILTQHERID